MRKYLAIALSVVGLVTLSNAAVCNNVCAEEFCLTYPDIGFEFDNCMNENCECGIITGLQQSLDNTDQAFSDFQKCTQIEYPRCQQLEAEAERKDCIKSARFSCLEESRLIEEFECGNDLTPGECVDLYSIALFKGKISKEQLMARIMEDNRESMSIFLDVLDSARVEIHPYGHYESAVKEGGEWNFEFGKKLDNVKGLLKDVKALHREYSEYKSNGVFDMMQMIYSGQKMNTMFDIKGLIVEEAQI